jgi:hypothetical protein
MLRPYIGSCVGACALAGEVLRPSPISSFANAQALNVGKPGGLTPHGFANSILEIAAIQTKPACAGSCLVPRQLLGTRLWRICLLSIAVVTWIRTRLTGVPPVLRLIFVGMAFAVPYALKV